MSTYCGMYTVIRRESAKLITSSVVFLSFSFTP